VNPPIVPRALVTAATPPVDHDSVIGDLHEEYLDRVRSHGRTHADSWYWSQALRSVPALLSYSRSRRSPGARIGTVVIVAVLLLTMLAVNEFAADVMCSFVRDTCTARSWPFYLVGWTDAAVFGAVLAAIVPSQGVRLAIISATALLVAIAAPIALGFSSRLTLSTWLLVFGAIPAMGLGAAAYQIVRRRR